MGRCQPTEGRSPWGQEPICGQGTHHRSFAYMHTEIPKSGTDTRTQEQAWKSVSICCMVCAVLRDVAVDKMLHREAAAALSSSFCSETLMVLNQGSRCAHTDPLSLVVRWPHCQLEQGKQTLER